MARAAQGRLIAGCLAVLLGACGSEQGPLDAGVADVPAIGHVEVGTGIFAFEPLRSEVTTPLVAGPQSGGRFEGHHVWAALRLVDLDPQTLSTYSIRVFDAEGGLAAEFVRDIANAPFEQDAEGRWVLAGLAPRLMDCCQVAGQDFTLVGVVGFPDGGQLIERAFGRAGDCSVTCP